MKEPFFSTTRPAFLKANDTIGVMAMASCLNYDDLAAGLEMLRNEWNLTVVEGKTLQLKHHGFAGTDQERADDFQAMLNDPTIKAIFSVRGGYGSSRILDQIDFNTFLKYPKWLIGFSDITAVHSHVYNLGVESIHATMPKLFGRAGAEEAVESLKNILFGRFQTPYHVAPNVLNRLGNATGNLVGGNLCLLAHLLGSKSEIDTTGCILFLEDVNEYLYNIDRMMVQLKRAGKLSNLAGLVVGQFSDSKENDREPFGMTADEIIAHHIQQYDYPVCFDFSIGHVDRNLAMPHGRRVKLSVGESGAELDLNEATAFEAFGCKV